ncbi:transposase [Corynebacterium marambiense]|uniref:transposase n=1 Tax=Corynebacterium marambiense TaxID=2765364 RepID=UPI00396A43C1
MARDPGVTLVQVATDFGVHVGTLDTWLRQERQGSGEQEGVCRSGSQELRDLRRRNRLLEQENGVLRRAAAYLSQVNLPGKVLPARETAGVRRDCCDVDVSGVEAVPGPV